MPSDATLLAVARRFVQAAEDHEQFPNTRTADAVTRARLDLQAAFLAAGWVPPRTRQDEMARDRLLVQQRVGAVETLPPPR
jgi:hypothetical protein